MLTQCGKTYLIQFNPLMWFKFKSLYSHTAGNKRLGQNEPCHLSQQTILNYCALVWTHPGKIFAFFLFYKLNPLCQKAKHTKWEDATTKMLLFFGFHLRLNFWVVHSNFDFNHFNICKTLTIINLRKNQQSLFSSSCRK